MKLSLGTLRLNMASKVVLTVFALAAIARIDTAGAGSFGRRPAAVKAAQAAPEAAARASGTTAEFVAAWSRSGTALQEPSVDEQVVEESDAIMDEFDEEDLPANVHCCGAMSACLEAEGGIEGCEGPDDSEPGAGEDPDEVGETLKTDRQQ